jgi:phenylalanyl-tRNA synthetase beta chain
MKVSLNWIKEFTGVKLPTDQLIEKIGAQLGAVEEVVSVGERYEGALIVKVTSCVKHPDADKLSICLIDDGGVNKPVKREPDGKIKVVCGALNVAKGQTVVWLPPGIVVPSTYGTEPLVLEAREIRGIVSQGMIASAKELAIGDDHTGILVIAETIKPGTPLVDAFKLDDTIIDIENKMFTHRPDLFGHLGIAREIAGIQQTAFKSPSWYTEEPAFPKTESRLPLTIKNDAAGLVPRFCAVVIENVQIGDSPMWLKARLATLGVRPINNVVDLTNYLMLESAQPIHAYDYDKLGTATLGIRQSRQGEKVTLLGGKTLSLEAGAVVITDGEEPIGLGGVMGGADAEVDKHTKNIILEVATFDMNQTRKTAMAYGLFTEAATRFTKNQSPKQVLAVLARATDEITKLAGGRVAGPVIDKQKQGAAKPDKPVNAEAGFINSRLGIELKAAEMKELLENVEIKTDVGGSELAAKVPFWRTDIAIAEDLVEEIGRLFGYDRLPLNLPKRAIKPAPLNRELDFKSYLRSLLSQSGANEVLTYSFVNEALINLAGQSSRKAFHIRNALSPNLQYYRLSLTPSLLEKVHPNIKAGYEELSLFELGRSHVKEVLDNEKLPAELMRVGYVLARKKPIPGAPYFHAKWLFDGLLQKLRIFDLHYKPLAGAKDLPQQWRVAAEPYEPARSAVVYKLDEKSQVAGIIGLIGEPTTSLKTALKLPPFTAMFEADQEILISSAAPPLYATLNRYPSIQQDITFRLGVAEEAGSVSSFLAEKLSNVGEDSGYLSNLELTAIFQRTGDKKHKNITWSLSLWHPDRTLTSAEANRIFDMLEAEAKQKFKAERV